MKVREAKLSDLKNLSVLFNSYRMFYGKKFDLKVIIWAITKKNPFKKKSYFDLNKRIKLSRSLTKKQKYIKVIFFEKKINSNKTINLIKFFKSKFKKKGNYPKYILTPKLMLKINGFAL